MHNKNILIVGGEGYIGNALYDHFSLENSKLSFDNLIYNQKIKKNSKKYKFINGDLRNKKILKLIKGMIL